ncbi:hypothetical protein RRU01S_04_01540 [Agrobacterium rubi TR3 = NBRC 13261]|uniref:ERF family protein n=1 Tax=Agrobacterium rubi TR3 = NBRC 13261 TaxID=1368415 RepID=A0A081CRN6_9HYPH|nr:ERF family protein [Agrobacterium rubi]MBP1876859.1 hypothetical protein [Agrobacterium rubi]MCL6651051.1 hypothetical protein [Agrobacterium rubi]GAK69332.1 hypothetical protein RRU01S_04_01540 [Agrobacterium rubi TR3 = NBRC 13261]
MDTQLAVQGEQSPAHNIIAVIERAATNPDVDIEKMERLLAMQERIMERQAKADFNAAMSDCQAEMQQVLMRHENKETKSKHAKIDDVDNVGRPIYTKHGFSLSFSSTETLEGLIHMTCTVRHRAGHETTLTKSGFRDDTGPKGGATKTKIQGSASTGTYLRRYLTCEAFNIVTTEMVQADNDGNRSVLFISPTQVSILVEKLGGPGERVAEFCKSVGLEGLHEADASEFDKLVARVTRFNQMSNPSNGQR